MEEQTNQVSRRGELLIQQYVIQIPLISFWKQWKPCYAVVTNSELTIFNSLKEFNSASDPFLRLDLEHCTVYPGSSDNLRDYHCFTVRYITKNQRIEHVFDAQDVEESARWINFLLKKSYDLPVMTASGTIIYQSDKDNQSEPTKDEKRQKAAKFLKKWLFVTMKDRLQFLKTRRLVKLLQNEIRRRNTQKMRENKINKLITIQTAIRKHSAYLKMKQLRVEVKIAKLQPYRTRVLMELFSTEETYVEQLDTLIRVFYKPLKALYPSTSNASPRMSQNDLTTIIKTSRNAAPINTIGKEHIATIFSNVEAILEKHRAFLVELRSTIIEQWSDKTRISHVFFEMATWLDIYVPYCNNFESSKETLYRCMKNNGFSEFIERAQSVKECHKLDLNSYLILPIQRIPRYELLLKDLIKHTWEEHPDYSGMKQSLMMMKEAARDMNRSKQYQKSKRKIDSLYRKVYGEERGAESSYLNEGPMNIVLSSDSKSAVYVFLFAEHLIVTKPVTKLVSSDIKYTPLYNIPLLGLTLKTEKKSLQFTLSTTSNDDYKMQADNFESKDRWVQDILDAIESREKDYWKSRFDNDISSFLSLNSPGSVKSLSRLDEDSPDSGKPPSELNSPF